MCLLEFKNTNISVSTPKIAKNPFLRALSMHFLWKTKNANNFLTVSPIIMKFGMQSLRHPSKSALFSKIEKNENPTWPPTLLFFVFLWFCPGQTIGRFGRAMRQNACLAQGGAS